MPTLKEIVDKHGLPVKVVGSNPISQTILYEGKI